MRISSVSSAVYQKYIADKYTYSNRTRKNLKLLSGRVAITIARVYSNSNNTEHTKNNRKNKKNFQHVFCSLSARSLSLSIL